MTPHKGQNGVQVNYHNNLNDSEDCNVKLYPEQTKINRFTDCSEHVSFNDDQQQERET